MEHRSLEFTATSLYKLIQFLGYLVPWTMVRLIVECRFPLRFAALLSIAAYSLPLWSIRDSIADRICRARGRESERSRESERENRGQWHNVFAHTMTLFVGACSDVDANRVCSNSQRHQYGMLWTQQQHTVAFQQRQQQRPRKQCSATITFWVMLLGRRLASSITQSQCVCILCCVLRHREQAR